MAINIVIRNHLDDKKVLEVVEFELFAPDGTSKGKERGIIQELPQPNEYSEMIINAILGKERKFNDYAQDLTHINLIVFDTEHRLQTLPIADFYKTFFIAKLSKVLYDTNFREIYLITMLDNGRKVYFPLKMLSLLANFYLFAELISDYPLEKLPQETSDNDDSSKSIVDIFAYYMKTKTNNILLNDEAGQKEAIFGNCGLIFENKEIIIHDHMDYPLPKNAQRIVENEITEFFKSAEFVAKEKEFMEKYAFLTELTFDTKGDWEY